MRACVVLALFSATAVAQGYLDAADAVVAARARGDAGAVRALAAKDAPDPWFVADELCARGEHDAAEAFAKAAPRKDVETLPEFVASRRGKPPETQARTALAGIDGLLAASRHRDALAALEKLAPSSNPVAEDANEPRVLDACLTNLGMLHFEEGEFEKARDCFERCVALIEEIGWRQGRAIARGGRPYWGMANVQLALGRPDEVLRYLERGRGRGVLDLLERSRVDLLDEAERRARAADDAEVLASIDGVRARLARRNRDIGELTYALSKAPSARKALQAKLHAARAAREEALEERARLVRDLVPAAQPLAPERIQAVLRKGERMLFYMVRDDLGIVLVVPPLGGEIRVYPLLGHDGGRVGELELASWVREHVDALSRPAKLQRGIKGVDRSRPRARERGRRLFFTLVPKPIREELAGLERVYVVPYGALHRLPFETLRWAGADRYWLDAGPPIAYVHSGSVLAWCRTRRDAQMRGPGRRDVVALGDPLFSRAVGEAAAPPESGVLVVSARDPLRAGDVVLAYDGRAVPDAAGLKREIRRVEDEIEERGRPGSAVTVRVWRAGKEEDVAALPGRLGVRVARETPRVAWERMRKESLATLQRGAPAERFGTLPQLPGTRREVDSIRTTLAGAAPVLVLLGEAATETRLARLGPRARYLHLATHQLVDETEQLGYSRLALTMPRVATPARRALRKAHPAPYHWAPFLYIGDPR